MDFNKLKPSEHLKIYTELSTWRTTGVLPDNSIFRKIVKDQTGNDSLQLLMIGKMEFFDAVFDIYGHEKLVYEAYSENFE